MGVFAESAKNGIRERHVMLRPHKGSYFVRLFVCEMSDNRINVETSFTVDQGCKLEEHYSVRCKENFFSDRFQKRHAFRLWHILLFLFVVAAIIVLLGLLSPGVLGRKKEPVSNGRKYKKEYNNVQHKASLNLWEVEINNSFELWFLATEFSDSREEHKKIGNR